MSSKLNKPRRPSLGDSTSAFYSGKAPANAGKHPKKARENAKNAHNVPAGQAAPKPAMPAPQQRVLIPDYTRNEAKGKGGPKVEVGGVGKGGVAKAGRGNLKRPSLSEQVRPEAGGGVGDARFLFRHC